MIVALFVRYLPPLLAAALLMLGTASALFGIVVYFDTTTLYRFLSSPLVCGGMGLMLLGAILFGFSRSLKNR